MAFLSKRAGKHVVIGHPGPSGGCCDPPLDIHLEPEESRRGVSWRRGKELELDRQVATTTGISLELVTHMRVNQKIAELIKRRKSDLPDAVIEAILMADDSVPASVAILNGEERKIARPPAPKRGRPGKQVLPAQEIA